MIQRIIPWYFFVVLLLCVGSAKSSETHTINSLDEIDLLLRDASNPVVDVDVQASVNYWDPDRRKLFVQDKESAIYVKLSPAHYEHGLNLRPGTRIRLIGNLKTAECIIQATTIEIVKQGAALEPMEVDIAKLPRGGHWSRRVKILGRVHCVVHTKTLTQMTIVSDNVQATCILKRGQSSSKFDSLVGSDVSVIGTMDWDVHGGGAARHAICQVADHNDISVINRAPPESDFIDVGSLSKAKNLPLGSRIRIEGVVGVVAQSDGFSLESSDGSVYCKVRFVEGIYRGHNLTVEGVLEEESPAFGLRLLHAQPSSKFFSFSPALPTNAGTILRSQINRRQVAVSGYLQHEQSNGDWRTLTLRDQGVEFRVVFSASDDQYDRLGVAKDCIVSAKGLVQQQPSTESAWFAVSCNSIEDVWVQHNAFFVDQRTLAWAIAVIAFCAVVGIAWLVTLRSQVRRKTQHLSGVTARLNASYESIEEGMVVFDVDESVIRVNHRFQEIVGESVTIGDPSNRVLDVLRQRFDPVDALEKGFCGGQDREPVYLQGIDKRLQDTDDSSDSVQHISLYRSSVCDEHGNMIGWLISMQDITSKKRLEKQFSDSQKLEAVGRLAGGVAHDFNNQLSVIISHLETARMITPVDDESAEHLAISSAAAERAANSVSSLLGFSRFSRTQFESSNINSLVLQIAQQLIQSTGESIRIDTELPSEVWPTKIDRSLIQQVLLNVCWNSIDAIHRDRGVIHIMTSNISIRDRNFVRIRIQDNGEGISEEAQAKIFEPFYTTKTDGAHGLGLSLAHGICSQHDGWMECSSSEGIGTTIDIFLPRARCSDDMDSESDALLPQDQTDDSHAASNKMSVSRILLVDDEDAVRKATGLVLTQLGYDVTDTDSGQEALRIVTEQKFDLVVLDQNMPGLSGRDVFFQIAQHHPHVPVVICTGFLSDPNEFATDFGATPAGFLNKPFRRVELEDVVSKAIRKDTLSLDLMDLHH